MKNPQIRNGRRWRRRTVVALSIFLIVYTIAVLYTFVVVHSQDNGVSTAPARTEDTSPSRIIFSNAITPGWEDWSWDSKVTPQETSPLGGSAALAIRFLQPWAGLSVHSTLPFATSAYTEIRFQILTEEEPEMSLYLELSGVASETGRVSLGVYTRGAPHQWREVRVPLSLFNVNQNITSLSLVSSEAGSILIDELRFE